MFNDTFLNVTVKNESVTPNFNFDQTASYVTVTFLNDISVEVLLYAGYLNIQVQLPSFYMGITKGLLGNGNGNASDEFIFQNGTLLDDSASDAEIHQFSQSCKSVFTGQNATECIIKHHMYDNNEHYLQLGYHDQCIHFVASYMHGSHIATYVIGLLYKKPLLIFSRCGKVSLCLLHIAT